MEVISYGDTLRHYQMKLNEVFDEIESISSQLRRAEEILEGGWSGSAAEACRTKIVSVNEEFSKSLSDVSEAILKLSDIIALFGEQNINLI